MKHLVISTKTKVVAVFLFILFIIVLGSTCTKDIETEDNMAPVVTDTTTVIINDTFEIE